MWRRAWVAGCCVAPLIVIAGCTTPAHPVSQNPPLVAAVAACRSAVAGSSSAQPVEIVFVEKGSGATASDNYISRFADLNEWCTRGGSGGSNSSSFTLSPNITAAQASRVAGTMQATGLFARVYEMTVPSCTTPNLSSGSCTPPTIP